MQEQRTWATTTIPLCHTRASIIPAHHHAILAPSSRTEPTPRPGSVAPQPTPAPPPRRPPHSGPPHLSSSLLPPQPRHPRYQWILHLHLHQKTAPPPRPDVPSQLRKCPLLHLPGSFQAATGSWPYSGGFPAGQPPSPVPPVTARPPRFALQAPPKG